MQYYATIAAASALFSFVSAHGGVVEYSFNGEIYAGYDPGRSSIKKRTTNGKYVQERASALIQREWDSWDPVDDVIGGVKTICNDPGSPATEYATIAAGGTVSACYNAPWAHNSGPLTVYMAACPDDDCTTIAAADLATLKWFAIYKEGLIDGTWATTAYMESNSNCITHIIPETLVAGSYLIRHETINLAKVEFYANCANVKVTGSGTATPDASFLKTFSEIYVDGDASLKAISSTPDSYTVPGPNVWPADTAEGGQIFEVTGIKNACSGQAQGSGGECADGGSDTSNPTPPNPQATGSTSSSSGSSSSDEDTSSATTTAKASKSTTTKKSSKSTTLATSAKSSKTTKVKAAVAEATPTSSSSASTDESTTDETADETTTDETTVAESSVAAEPIASATKSVCSAKATSIASSAGAIEPIASATESVSTPAATDSSSTDSSSSSSGSVAAYGQCGGSGYTGSTTCASGTCTEMNSYYSQCI